MISLALPTYNGVKYLRDQLDSIYNQTLPPDEVIVVDDKSTDGTLLILEEYHIKYGLKYFVNEINLGYNKNFEKAISLCTGDYIILSDQDDIWLENKIEKLYNVIKQYRDDEPSLVSCLSSPNKNILKSSNSLKNISGDWKLNFTRYQAQGCTLMFNKCLRDVAIPFPCDIIYDAYLSFTASMIGNRFYLGEKLQWYRIHESNSLVKNKKFSIFERVTQELKKYAPFWFGITRYKNLLVMKIKYNDYIPLNRLEYINKILQIYEVSGWYRLLKFILLPDVSIKQKIKTGISLTVKNILKIKDSE